MLDFILLRRLVETTRRLMIDFILLQSLRLLFSYIYIRQLSKQVLHTRDRFGRRQFFFFLLFFPPHPVYYLHTYFTPLPPINSRNSDPGSHRRLFFPLPTKVCTLHFYRGKTSALSSSVDSRRVTPTNARSTPQLILFQFWK